MPEAHRACNTIPFHHFTGTLHLGTCTLEKKVKCRCKVHVAVCTLHHAAPWCEKVQKVQGEIIFTFIVFRYCNV